MENIDLLDEVITGRIEPYIYAFETGEIPNYVKVGDTYRPVPVRLQEWKKYYPDLKELHREKAMVNNEVFFRDYSVHVYLEDELGKKRLQPTDLLVETYYSREFFRDTSVEDICFAIKDIKEKYEDNVPSSYQYYNASVKTTKDFVYKSTGMWTPRPNQQEAIDNFKKAVDKGRKNLLMYAVMRFGKSFTSLCCAKAIDAKIIVVVSAKVDVLDEWQKTVQSAENFCNEYVFLTATDLSRDNDAIGNILKTGKGVVVFLSLADLQGDEIKDKHKEILSLKIDLLIVDETHYGARAYSYGKILENSALKDADDEKYDEDYVDILKTDEVVKKALNAEVRLHLSGTPYRILMGSEFGKEDIITFCQFSDIVEEQEKWDAEHVLLDDVKEWDNPYYGFPQMVRFAFNPSKKALNRLEELKRSGSSYAFSELFKTKSLKKNKDGKHKEFIFKEVILDLFLVIDGAREDDELLGFLNYEKIKEGNMCRHIVCILPYCASCDALEKLLIDNRDKFNNLQDYKIINISGIEHSGMYKSTKEIKRKIAQCEGNNEKTITLTVNRMLTGSTVKEWDTMFYFKDTSSPQEYDQAIFRLQNQYIKEYKNEDGEIIKYNMKPQTLLVDFNPYRLFSMQEQKALIYNVNMEKAGNKRLTERMETEIRISPIISVNKNKLVRVSANDVLQQISEYSNKKGVLEETLEIPVDFSLLDIDSVRDIIEKQAEIGSKNGLQMNAHIGEETDLEGAGDNSGKSGTNSSSGSDSDNKDNDHDRQNEYEKLKRQFQTYYSRILFYAFLTDSNVKSLDEIIQTIDEVDNTRISSNLGIERGILATFVKYMNPFILSKLDYKIQNINRLSKDESITPIERAICAIEKFGKLSESEIPTPIDIAYDMVCGIPDSCIYNLTKEGSRILDIASKIGEFAIAICRRAGELGVPVEELNESVLSIPTSSIAYEFTRKIYTILGLDTNSIASSFSTYDLMNVFDENNNHDYETISNILHQDIKLNEIDINNPIKEGAEMKFEAIVGNPPYQESISTNSDNTGLGKQLFPYFTIMSLSCDAQYTSLIIPSRWFTGDAQDKSFIKLRRFIKDNNNIKSFVNYIDENDVFKNVEIKGGVGYFLSEKGYKGKVEFTNISDGEKNIQRRDLFIEGLDVVISDANCYPILKKVLGCDFVSLMDITTGRNAFGIIGKLDVVNKISSETYKEGLCELRCKNGSIRYIDPEIISKNKDIFESYKVFISKSSGSPKSDRKIIGCPYVGGKNTACTDTFFPIGCFDTEVEANNLAKYLKTRFLRFLVSILKSSHNVTQIVYKYVPMQDFTENSDIDWSGSIDEIDECLYKKYSISDEEKDFINTKIDSMEED